MLDEVELKRRICERLGVAITALGLTQKEVAQACGVSQPRLNNWLAGLHFPTHHFLYRFCRRYPITADYLLSGSVQGISGPLGDALLAAEAAFSADV